MKRNKHFIFYEDALHFYNQQFKKGKALEFRHEYDGYVVRYIR